MMCEAARGLLERYLENQLSPLQKEKIDEHLRECRACSTIVSGSRGYLVCLEKYFGWIKPSDALVESVLYNLADSEIGKKRTASDLKTASAPAVAGAPKPSRRAPVIALLAVAVIAAGGYVVYRKIVAPSVIGKITMASGSVERRSAPDSSWTKVEGEPAFAPGDSLRTGATSKASIKLARSGNIDLGPASRLTVTGDGRGQPLTAELELGSATVQILPGETALSITAGQARATLAEPDKNDSRLSVEMKPGAETVFSAEHGTFRISTATPQGEVSIAPGARAVVRAGKAPALESATKTAPPSDRTKPPVTPPPAGEPPLVQAAREGESKCVSQVLQSPTLGRSDVSAIVTWIRAQKKPEDVRRGLLALSVVASSTPDHSPDAVAELSRVATQDAAVESRKAAVEMLAGIPGDPATRALRDVALKDQDATVAKRSAAALALREGNEVPSALSAVLKGAKDPGVKREAAKGAVLTDPGAAAVLGGDPPADVLAKAASGPAGLAEAIKTVKDPSIRYRLLARAETLAASGGEGAAALTEAVASVAEHDDNPVLKRRAARSLGAFKADAAPAKAALRNLLADRDESVKVAASLSILALDGDESTVQAGPTYQRIGTPALKLEFARGIASALPPAAAAKALAKISDGEQRAPLKTAVESVRRTVAPGTGGSPSGTASPPGPTGGARTGPGPGGADAADPMAAIASTDPEARLRAVGALARGASAGSDDGVKENMKAALRNAVLDEDERVAQAAATALAAFKDDETFDALKQAFTRGASVSVRSAALESIAQFSQREDLVEVLGTALGEEGEEDIRVRIVNALKSHEGPAVTDALLKSLAQDRSGSVQAALIDALGARKEGKAGAALVAVLEAAEPSARAAVVVALRRFAGQSFEFDPKASEDEQQAAIAAIREWWGQNASQYP